MPTSTFLPSAAGEVLDLALVAGPVEQKYEKGTTLAIAAPMTEAFDGHANCFVESGNGKGMLIDFNYTTQPLTGKYPLPGVGLLAAFLDQVIDLSFDRSHRELRIDQPRRTDDLLDHLAAHA